jgi:hypothetical protein
VVLLREAQRLFPEVAIHAYLDDVTLSGRGRAVAGAVVFIREELEKVGLELNPKKCQYLLGAAELGDPLASFGFEKVEECIKALGAWVGDPVACAREVSRSTRKHLPFFDTVRACEEVPAHARLRMLLQAGVPRMGYTARVHPPEVTAEASTWFDQQVSSCLETVMEVPPLSPCQYEQLQLPLALGGMGVVRYATTAPLAYEASTTGQRQQDLTASATEARLQRVLGESEETAARVLSCQGKGCWLQAERMPDQCIRFACRWRLGFPEPIPTLFCTCGLKLSAETVVSHSLSCPRLTHVRPHDAVTQDIAELLRECGLGVSLVKGQYGEEDGKRPDLYVFLPHRTVVLDVTLANPIARSYTAAAATSHLRTATIKENAKVRKHGPAATSLNHEFVPVALEAFGGIGRLAQALFDRLTTGTPCRSTWRSRVSSSLQRAIHAGFLTAVRRLQTDA